MRQGLILAFLLQSAIASAATLPQQELPELIFGTSTVLSGPAQQLGKKFNQGVLSAFKEVNDQGGIKGRRVSLRALDDAYEPALAAPNMRTLVRDAGVLAIIGNVGTPTAVVSVPIAVNAQIPFLFPYTGASILRKNPPERWVLNFRASYADEVEAMIEALIVQKGLAPEDIAFFTQRDAYGDAGFSVGLTALRGHGLRSEGSIAHVRYDRNTVAVELALADLLAWPRPPRAVIMVGTYAPCAAFIRIARENNFNPTFLNVSFVGSGQLAEALGAAGDGVIITQVVPSWRENLPAADAFRAALQKLDPGAQPSGTAFEGYLAARILIRALEAENVKFTRAGILAALEGLGEFDLGIGVPLKLSPDSHQACRKVWPTRIRNRVVEPLEWKDLTVPAGASR